MLDGSKTFHDISGTRTILSLEYKLTDLACYDASGPGSTAKHGFELAGCGGQDRGLPTELMALSGDLLRLGSRLLGYAVHLRYGASDFLDTAVLFPAAVGHLIRQLLHAVPDSTALLPRLADHDHMSGRRIGGSPVSLHELRRLLRGLRTTLRQVAYFIRYNGKTGARFACPRRFHRRIQSKDIRLERDFVNRV